MEKLIEILIHQVAVNYEIKLIINHNLPKTNMFQMEILTQIVQI